MNRIVSIVLATLVILVACGVSDNVIEDRRIRSNGSNPGVIIYEVRTDLYGWKKVTPAEYRRCKRGDIYPDCKK